MGVMVYEGGQWKVAAGVGQAVGPVEVLNFTNPGSFTFSPANYPGLRAVKVTCVGGGGGGQSGGLTNNQGGGGGGAGAASISLLSAAQVGTAGITVTVGNFGGGSAHTDGADAASGGTSSFGTLVTAAGGQGGGQGTPQHGRAGAGGAISGVGDILIAGGDGSPGCDANYPGNQAGNGGNSIFGGGGAGGAARTANEAGRAGSRGAGGGGGFRRSADAAGGNGGAGVVQIEVYAELYGVLAPTHEGNADFTPPYSSADLDSPDFGPDRYPTGSITQHGVGGAWANRPLIAGYQFGNGVLVTRMRSAFYYQNHQEYHSNDGFGINVRAIRFQNTEFTWGPWVNVGDLPWQNLAFLNGWVRYSTGFQPFSFKMLGNQVLLRGLVKSGTATHIGTLPVGARPMNSSIFNQKCSGGSTRVDITAQGAIIITLSGGDVVGAPATWTSLEAITFGIG